MIRPARFADIPALTALIDEARASSRYAHANLHVVGVKKALMAAISSQGQDMAPGSMAVFVAEKDGAVVGLILGYITRLYEMLDLAVATDFIWYVRPDADARAALGLLNAFHAWAETFPGPIIIRQVANDAITDPTRTQHMLARKGMTVCGIVYEKGVRT